MPSVLITGTSSGLGLETASPWTAQDTMFMPLRAIPPRRPNRGRGLCRKGCQSGFWRWMSTPATRFLRLPALRGLP